MTDKKDNKYESFKNCTLYHNVALSNFLTHFFCGFRGNVVFLQCEWGFYAIFRQHMFSAFFDTPSV